MGGTNGDYGAGFDADGMRKGWRLYTGHGVMGRHNPGPYLKNRASLKALCRAARNGKLAMMFLARKHEPETAAWLEKLEVYELDAMVDVLSAMLGEL
jgi:hypothetical protein